MNNKEGYISYIMLHCNENKGNRNAFHELYDMSMVSGTKSKTMAFCDYIRLNIEGISEVTPIYEFGIFSGAVLHFKSNLYATLFKLKY